MKVTSSKTVDFPSLGWGIRKGEVMDLPADKEAAKIILAHERITEVKAAVDIVPKKADNEHANKANK